MQQTIIDPEGDFITLADRFGHLVIDAEAHTEHGLQLAGERARIHRVSTILNLEGLDAENQPRSATRGYGARQRRLKACPTALRTLVVLLRTVFGRCANPRGAASPPRSAGTG